MKEHLKSLITRLSQFSQKLDQIALFADKKWVIIDEEGNQQSYIFERDGDLVMSKNGKVKMGKWKFYPQAQSIKIDRGEDQILLNHAFFDEALMVLKYDGAPNHDFFVLADQHKIPDLDIVKYLEKKVKTNELPKERYKKGRVHELKLENGDAVKIFQRDWETFFRIGDKILIKGSFPDDGEYFTRVHGRKFQIMVKSGVIVDFFCYHKYIMLNNQTVIVRSKLTFNIQKGDRAYNENMIPLKSGKYGLDILRKIVVKDGVIVKFRLF